MSHFKAGIKRKLLIVLVIILFLFALTGVNYFLSSLRYSTPDFEEVLIEEEIEIIEKTQVIEKEQEYVLYTALLANKKGKVFALDEGTLNFVKSIEFRRPATDVVLYDGLLYFTGEEGEGWVEVYNPTLGKIVSQYRTENSYGLTVTDDFIYVSDPDNEAVYSIDKDTSVVKTIELDASPYFIDYHKRDERIYVSLSEKDEVAILNPAISRLVKVIRVGLFPQQFVFTDDWRVVIVPNSGDNGVSFVPINLLRETDDVITGDEPTAIVLGNGGVYAYVANYGSNDVAVVNIQQQKRILSIPVGNGPSSIVLHPDGEWIYVANSLDGTVSVINRNSLQVSDVFSVGEGIQKLIIAKKEVFE